MSPAERSEIRRALDGAVLNVALLSATLKVGRRLTLRLDGKSRYALKYAGTRHPIMTTTSVPVMVRFLDHFGEGDGAKLPVVSRHKPLANRQDPVQNQHVAGALERSDHANATA